ncbi:hypothetical protein DGo_CA2125 [Deinococcus gobiensis I-0]|uniref:Uncharacterized protein n=1 Tax=Deinococcus gobiensis (strain DSM 21396 / JCM 16679 / CGMCC 1.7299 / I-0) TaxID=745776 RepID=H8GYK5_DEIGI|nr:hypothetical protein DGo_CA2125 [Deinococcus gobiensis I-0]
MRRHVYPYESGRAGRPGNVFARRVAPSAAPSGWAIVPARAIVGAPTQALFRGHRCRNVGRLPRRRRAGKFPRTPLDDRAVGAR